MTTTPPTAPEPAAPPRVVVVIPALHPGADLPAIVRAIRQGGLPEVLVVDDGSGPDYAAVFEEIAGLEGCTVLHHAVNQGKGVALKTAFRHCRDRADVAGVVTADADGQHDPADILRVARALTAGAPPEAKLCVLGARNLTGPEVPLRSRLGNRITSGVMKVLHGRFFQDTQTGLRGFSRGLFDQVIGVSGRRFEYEMNVLMELLAHRVRIEEVPIATIYTDPDNSPSHFRPVHDSLAIYAHIFRQAGAFVLSSGLGALVDLVTFVLVMDLGFDGQTSLVSVGTATVVARAVSSLVNYAINRHVVFGARRPVVVSFPRYVLLVVVILVSSTLGTTAISHLLGGRVVWAKIITDSTLFLASYLLQKHWVFAASRRGRG